MSIWSILTRLSYPHKFSAIPYFLRDPRLVFGIPNRPTKMHISSAIEQAMEANIIEGLHNFLPGWFLDHIERENLCDKVGFCLLLYLLVRKYAAAATLGWLFAYGSSALGGLLFPLPKDRPFWRFMAAYGTPYSLAQTGLVTSAGGGKGGEVVICIGTLFALCALFALVVSLLGRRRLA